MLVEISNWVIKEVLKLQAVEEGRVGNYTKIDERIDKFRYRVSDLVISSVIKEIHKQQNYKLPSYLWNK